MTILSAGMERTSGQQFGYIVLALVCTLGISIISGLITGNLKLSIGDALHHRQRLDGDGVRCRRMHFQLITNRDKDVWTAGVLCLNDEGAIFRVH